MLILGILIMVLQYQGFVCGSSKWVGEIGGNLKEKQCNVDVDVVC